MYWAGNDFKHPVVLSTVPLTHEKKGNCFSSQKLFLNGCEVSDVTNLLLSIACKQLATLREAKNNCYRFIHVTDIKFFKAWYLLKIRYVNCSVSQKIFSMSIEKSKGNLEGFLRQPA